MKTTCLTLLLLLGVCCSAVAQEAAPALLKTAATGAEAARKDALAKLRKLAGDQPKEAIALLKQGLADKDTKVRELATNELLRIGSDEAMAALDTEINSEAKAKANKNGGKKRKGKRRRRAQSPQQQLDGLLQAAQVKIAEKAAQGAPGLDDARKQLATLQAQAAGKAQVVTGTDTHVHVISIYESTPPAGVKREAGFAPFGICTVKVTDTSAPVVLVLTSYARTRWKIELAEGVKLKSVHAHGYRDQWIIGVPAGIKVDEQSFVETRSGLWTSSKPNHKAMSPGFAKSVQKLTGRPATTFFGTYRARPAAIVLGPGSPAWRTQVLLPRAQQLLQNLEK